MNIDFAAPLELYQGTVQPEWVDYNGHLNDGYYAVAFGLASERFLKLLEVHAEYLAATHCTIYTAEAHLVYVRELAAGAPLRITLQLLGYDAKRFHVYLEMFHQQQGYLAAAYEAMFLHVCRGDQVRVTPMPSEKRALLARLMAAHAHLKPPKLAGRRLHMPG